MLEVCDLRAGYGKAVIVDGVSLSVPAGSIVALLGGNGTGKSTTLRAICGLLAPLSGEIVLSGTPLQGLSAPEVVGHGLCLVPQGKEVFAEMTVRENLMMGGYLLRGSRGAVARGLDEVMARFPRLAELASRRAGLLSGGERQLLAVGRALMSKPRALLLDEPSAALSPKVVATVAETILELKADGLAILLVEQNVNLALRVAERLYVLREGRIALDRAVVGGEAGEDLTAYYFGVTT